MKKINLPYWLHSRLAKKFSQLYAELIITTKDESGNIIKTHKQVCNSYLANFAQITYLNFAGRVAGAAATPYGVTLPYSSYALIDSLNFNIGYAVQYRVGEGLLGDCYSGLIVGTTNTAPTANDVKLGTLITHGTGVGQLQYGLQYSTNGVTTLANVSSFSMTRTFVNNSGSPITVAEMGFCTFYSGTRYFLMLRDLLSPSQVVNNAQTLTIQLITQITT